jgi:hypothetical protein
MSRLRQLNVLITSIDKEEKANALVKGVLPNQAAGIDSPMLGTEAGVRNCSLIAEFVVTYFTYGKVRYSDRIIGSAHNIKKGSTFDFKKHLTGDPQAMVGELGGHNIALVREGNLYALYQAWEGRYHVFPRLNEDGESHNIFGTGDDTVSLINKEVASLEAETGTPIVLKNMS